MKKTEKSLYFGRMSLPVLSKLARVYAPSSQIIFKMQTVDLVLCTDQTGRVQQFKMGNHIHDGVFTGENFECKFVTDDQGKMLSLNINFLGKV